MHNQLQLHIGSTSQAAARVYFTVLDNAKITSASGKLRGPYCKYARTLPAEFPVQLSTHPANQQTIAESLVIDPCYWSPTLPYTYEIELQLQLESGQEISHQGTLGMRQWHCRQENLYLDSRRTVLRGYRVHDFCEETVQQARKQESSLLIEPDDLTTYEAADSLGVGLMIDLRNTDESLHDQLHNLNWSPAALIAMVNAEQISQLDKPLLPQQFLLAQSLTSRSTIAEIEKTRADILVVGLDEDERPPSWTANVEQPVIAIRSGVSENQCLQPRRSCETLQADLAPEFNLAGYFISP